MRGVRPAHRLSHVVRHVVGVHLIQVSGLNLVRLLEEGGDRKQQGAQHRSDGKRVEASATAQSFMNMKTAATRPWRSWAVRLMTVSAIDVSLLVGTCAEGACV